MRSSCYCGHAYSAHNGRGCTRCGCPAYVPDTGREPDSDPLEDPAAGERQYEKYLNRIQP